MGQIRQKKMILIWVLAGGLVASIVSTASMEAYAQSQIVLNGAGATFPFPLIDKWRVEYQNVQPKVSLNYQSIGSGGGIRQFTEKTVDFGATDAPLTAQQFQAAKGAVHLPETIGSVVTAYNIIGIKHGELKLTGPLIADIFLGKITKWDDPAIKALNPTLPLPSKDIIVVHRSDGSGTTFVWTDYLSKISPEWNEKVGRGTAVQWPVGIGAPGNEGVANGIRGTAYTIGYIELAYALTTKMSFAMVQNQAGNFIEASLSSVRAAVASETMTLPKGDESWENVTMTNAKGNDSYPVASFSYLLVYKELSTFPSINSMDRAKALVNFIGWAVTDGQQFADDLSYVPLPEEVVKLDQDTLKMLTYKGEPVLTQTPTPTPEPDEKPFMTTATLDGSSYTINGMSKTVMGASVNVDPLKSVNIQFNGSGDVQLTLPTSMIEGIHTIKAGDNTIQFTQVSTSPSSTTIKFTVPADSTSVQIMGAKVVPEFSTIVTIILGISLIAVIGVSALSRGNYKQILGKM